MNEETITILFSRAKCRLKSEKAFSVLSQMALAILLDPFGHLLAYDTFHERTDERGPPQCAEALRGKLHRAIMIMLLVRSAVSLDAKLIVARSQRCGEAISFSGSSWGRATIIPVSFVSVKKEE